MESSLKNNGLEARQQVRAYLAALPVDARKRLQQMRKAILAAAPNAVDGFSYGVPSFKLDGQSVVWYAAFKNHTSIYPMTDSIRRAYASKLKGLKTSTGTIQFPLAEPLPSLLVTQLVRARISEIMAKGKR